MTTRNALPLISEPLDIISTARELAEIPSDDDDDCEYYFFNNHSIISLLTSEFSDLLREWRSLYGKILL